MLYHHQARCLYSHWIHKILRLSDTVHMDEFFFLFFSIAFSHGKIVAAAVANLVFSHPRTADSACATEKDRERGSPQSTERCQAKVAAALSVSDVPSYYITLCDVISINYSAELRPPLPKTQTRWWTANLLAENYSCILACEISAYFMRCECRYDRWEWREFP